MLTNVASGLPAATPLPHIIALDEEYALDAFTSEAAPARGPAPATLQLDVAAAVEAPLVAASAASPSRTARRPPRRLPKGVVPAASTLLMLAALGVPAVSLFTAAPGAVPLSSGAVTITSEPPGRTVRVDGVYRGVTPFATMLVAGEHDVEVGDGVDLRRRELRVRPAADVLLHVGWTPSAREPARGVAAAALAARDESTRAAPAGDPPAVPRAAVELPARGAVRPPGAAPETTRAIVATAAAGTLTVASPFPVRVLVDGIEVGTDSTPRLAVAAGTRAVRLVNERLEFDLPLELTVSPRRTHPLTVAPPHGTLHVNASPWAHVSIDGRRIGETPIANLTLPIGEHELVLRHPELGEERRTITVGARTPVRVGVELGQ